MRKYLYNPRILLAVIAVSLAGYMLINGQHGIIAASFVLLGGIALMNLGAVGLARLFGASMTEIPAPQVSSREHNTVEAAI